MDIYSCILAVFLVPLCSGYNIPGSYVRPGPGPPSGIYRPDSRPSGYDPDIRPPLPPPDTFGPREPWQYPAQYQNKPPPWQQSNYNQPPPPPYQSASFQGGNPPYAPGYQQNQIQPYHPINQGRPPYGPPMPARPFQPNPYPGPPSYKPLVPPPPPPYQPGPPVIITTTPPPTKATVQPIDIMADITNHLGTRILLDHASARGNFVFSPYGAASVLAVLHEGATGNSARQLAQTLDLPRDIELVRVGMRDLHRHLKSYFGHNGFLQGVDLSNNNTSLRSDFVPLLRFYGYHVDDRSNMTTTMAPMTTTMPPETTTMAPVTTTTSTTEEEVTEVIDTDITGGGDVNSPLMQEGDGSPTEEPSPEPTPETPEEEPVPEPPPSEEPAPEVQPEEPPPSEEAPSEEPPTEEPPMEMVTEEMPTEETTMEMVEETSMEPMEMRSDDEATPLPEEPMETPPENEIVTEEPARKKRAMNMKYVTMPRTPRRQSTRRPSHQALFPDIELNNGIEGVSKPAEGSSMYDTQGPRRRFRLFNGDFTRPIPVIERREILPFASLPHLRAIAALLPLDEPRYGLLILLPTDGRGAALKQLSHALTQTPLKHVLGALRPSRLQATIPAFSADGTVVLTSSLQQLGVWDIFDPRLARLNGMSNDHGLFVRELEQSIHMDFGSVRSLHTRVVTARSTSEVLDAMKPFLYFVIDRETRTALMAGKVEDPSTARIF